jgi:adenylate cyclase
MPLSLSLRHTFSAPPERIWPIVADTERLNRSLGLPATSYEALTEEREVNRLAVRARQMGLPLEFEEEPFEWVENESYSVVRHFPRGPFRSFRGGCTLHAVDTGTELHVWAEFEPRSPAARLLFGLVRNRVAADWNRLAERVRRSLKDGSAAVYGPGVDAATEGQRAEVLTRLKNAPTAFSTHPLAPRLVEHLAGAGDVDLERIRPFRLARQWESDRYQVLALCLRAAREGVLDLSWDLVCPNCRGTEYRALRLDQLRTQAHCDACHIVYDVNFDRYVEATFRPNPRYRRVVARTFCAAGPRNTPHILAQIVLLPGEERRVCAELPAGMYRLRTLTAGAAALVEAKAGQDVESPALIARLGADGLALEPGGGVIEPGAVRLTLDNATEAPAQIVLERLAWDEDCATAAMVSVFQEFRDLFGSEALAPDVQLGIESLPILFTDLKGSTALYQRLGDAAAWALVRDHFRFLQDAVTARGGGIIKTLGDSVMAAFPDAAAALECALAVQRATAPWGDVPLAIKIGLHQGPCIAVRADDRLDYFGTTVNIAARLHDQSQGGDVVVSEAIYADPAASPLLAGCRTARFEASLRGISAPQQLWRVLASRQPVGAAHPLDQDVQARFG